MPDTRHEAEAEKILSALNSSLPDDQSRRLLAEALATAELRGRQIYGREKESSGYASLSSANHSQQIPVDEGGVPPPATLTARIGAC